jgi:hypothetical protein
MIARKNLVDAAIAFSFVSDLSSFSAGFFSGIETVTGQTPVIVQRSSMCIGTVVM